MSALKSVGSRLTGSAPVGSFGAADALAGGLSSPGGLGTLVAAGPFELLAHPAQMSVAATTSDQLCRCFLFMSSSPRPFPGQSHGADEKPVRARGALRQAQGA